MYFYVTVFMACEYKEQLRVLPGIASNVQQNQLVATALPVRTESVVVFCSPAGQRQPYRPGLCPLGFLCPKGSNFTVLLVSDN